MTVRHHERLIAALDRPERSDIVSLARALSGTVGMVKVGLEAFVAHGPDLVRELEGLGHRIFLDLKLHDIPRTAAAAARQASNLGVELLTVHAGGGAEMVRAAVDAVEGRTQIMAVTLLTSLDESAVRRLGFAEGVEPTVRRLGEQALRAGAAGLVSSAHELAALESLGGRRVVPGVRPAGVEAGDQKRVVTPQEAVSMGATWIVVGRPIYTASDPAAAAVAIVRELGHG